MWSWADSRNLSNLDTSVLKIQVISIGWHLTVESTGSTRDLSVFPKVRMFESDVCLYMFNSLDSIGYIIVFRLALVL